MELRFILGPELFHCQNGLPGLPPTMFKVAAHDFGFLQEPSSADAKYESSV